MKSKLVIWGLHYQHQLDCAASILIWCVPAVLMTWVPLSSTAETIKSIKCSYSQKLGPHNCWKKKNLILEKHIKTLITEIIPLIRLKNRLSQLFPASGSNVTWLKGHNILWCVTVTVTVNKWFNVSNISGLRARSWCGNQVHATRWRCEALWMDHTARLHLPPSSG